MLDILHFCPDCFLSCLALHELYNSIEHDYLWVIGFEICYFGFLAAAEAVCTPTMAVFSILNAQ